ncbi:transposase [Rhodocytophaga aerolata]|uniref:Transposase n=1 Tax=Rhodocytophaga aerolata TaxID=455078 RepID=A0ABT8RLA7_9BACT|nr:transposase [Rhodocytophaga aerolata]MDO1451842.1 transposase [Rhodocytophaga aerolata]
MKAISAFQTILAKMNKVSKPLESFLNELLIVFLSLKGRYCFRNLSRWASFCEHTISRNFAKAFDFYLFQQQFMDCFLQGRKLIAVVDCSFVTKAGKATFGVDKFFSSTVKKAVKGLELSLIALADTESREAFSLHVRQTKAGLGQEQNRIDYYLEQIEAVKDYVQKKVEYFVADGFYAKKKVVDKITGLGFGFISKLRSDADMKYLYTGEHEKRKGAKKKYEGKIIWKDCFEKFTLVTRLDNGISLYSKNVYSMCLKRQVRVLVLQTYNSKGKMGYALLFSTNIKQAPEEIYHYYSLRFAIEFLFKDAKSHLGLLCYSPEFGPLAKLKNKY